VRLVGKSAKVGVLWCCFFGLSQFRCRLLFGIPGGPWFGCKSLGVLQGCVLFGALFLLSRERRACRSRGLCAFSARLNLRKSAENWVIKELGADYDCGGLGRGKRGVFLAGVGVRHLFLLVLCTLETCFSTTKCDKKASTSSDPISLGCRILCGARHSSEGIERSNAHRPVRYGRHNTQHAASGEPDRGAS